ncbi:MAG TPA: branched-chain amino acid ABC transporter permease [Anaerolineae bacterium]|nr:branched-chain amino acid ABC transporter permease [Anaerolineae bacterium]HPL29241.1 branched-chain amino acid ABC transporter permease [Anaerolineae bacterium]
MWKRIRSLPLLWTVVGAAIVLAPSFTRGVGYRTGYFLQLYSLLPIWIAAALSLTMITGYIGEVSLGQGALMGVAAYVSAVLSTRGVPIVISVIAALVMAVIGAMILGFPTLRIRGPYFVVSSMAFNGMFYELALNWLPVTGGPSGISNVPSYALVPFIGQYVPWVVAAICMLAVWYIGQTRLGKSMMAVREDEMAAGAIGLRVAFLKSIAFLISGLVAGLAGVSLVHFVGFVSPEFYSINQSLLLLTMVLLGGARRVEGAVVGCLLMFIVQEVLRPFAEVQLLCYGVVMLLVVQFFPRGLVSLFERQSSQ